MRFFGLFARQFCTIFVLVQLASCKGGGVPGVGGLQGDGLLGGVGDVVRGYAANSRVMIDIRSQIAMIVSKLNMIAMRRVQDFRSTQKVEEVEQWMDSITQKVFNVTVKRAKACVDEFRHDLSTVRAFRSFVMYALYHGCFSPEVRSDTQAYEVVYGKLLAPLWVEFINMRAHAIVAMLNTLQYSLESLGAQTKKLEQVLHALQSVSSGAPV